jgi:hypothetical protein
MILKRLITAILVLLVVSSIGWAFIKEMRPAESNPTSTGSQSAAGADLIGDQGNSDSDSQWEVTAPVVLASDNLKPDRIQVYYFHRTIRCTGCINVEEGAFEAVSVDHKANIDNGTLEWHSIDFDQPENKHYAKDYDLYSQELILFEVRNDAIVRSNKIADVWQHWNSKSEVRSLANDLIDQWLGGIG